MASRAAGLQLQAMAEGFQSYRQPRKFEPDGQIPFAECNPRMFVAIAVPQANGDSLRMGNERDVFEWRRFGHWKTSAQKAHFSSYALWYMLKDPDLGDVVQASGHRGGDAGLALLEGFRRESSVALELIVKAVIAAKMQAAGADPAMQGIPATHDLPKLWLQAGLPKLEQPDRYRLVLVKSTLMWSGRYPTPRTVKAWEEENKEFDLAQEPPNQPGRFVIRTPISFDWENFDRLYQIANAAIPTGVR